VTEILPVEKLRPAPDNPRKNLGDVTELAASIRSQGLLQPLLVTPQDDGYYLVVAGHRRLAACLVAGLAEVECTVRQMDDVARNEAMVTENMQRASLTVVEEAQAYQRLVDLGVPQRRIATRLGRAQSHVSKRLALLGLAGSVRTDVDSGRISVGDALELVKLKDPSRVQAVLARWGGANIARAVAIELENIKNEAARAKAIEKLGVEGTKIVPFPEYGSWYGRRKERPLGKGWEEVAMTPRRHAKEPCHAAAVSEKGGIIFVCTDPARHGEALSPGKAKAAAAEAKKLVERKQLRDAAKARSEVMRQLLAKRLPRTELWPFVARQVVANARAGEARAACQLLGLQPPPQRNGSIYKDWTEAVRLFAAEGAEQLARAALALSFGTAEESMAPEWGSWTHAGKVPNHLAFLERVGGYQPSAVELDKVRSERQDDDQDRFDELAGDGDKDDADLVGGGDPDGAAVDETELEASTDSEEAAVG
jgi:ParB/RepB/Spo0J family partition protein